MKKFITARKFMLPVLLWVGFAHWLGDHVAGQWHTLFGVWNLTFSVAIAFMLYSARKAINLDRRDTDNGDIVALMLLVGLAVGVSYMLIRPDMFLQLLLYTFVNMAFAAWTLRVWQVTLKSRIGRLEACLTRDAMRIVDDFKQSYQPPVEIVHAITTSE